MTVREQRVDVICQHTTDASIIPIKMRMKDEDGEFQIYTIKSYREISHPSDYSLPNGIRSHSHLWFFECKISVFDRERIIRLFYNANENTWTLRPKY